MKTIGYERLGDNYPLRLTGHLRNDPTPAAPAEEAHPYYRLELRRTRDYGKAAEQISLTALNPMGGYLYYIWFSLREATELRDTLTALIAGKIPAEEPPSIIKTIAAMQQDGEDGYIMTSEDAVDTLNRLIEDARNLVD